MWNFVVLMYSLMKSNHEANSRYAFVHIAIAITKKMINWSLENSLVCTVTRLHLYMSTHKVSLDFSVAKPLLVSQK